MKSKNSTSLLDSINYMLKKKKLLRVGINYYNISLLNRLSAM